MFIYFSLFFVTAAPNLLFPRRFFFFPESNPITHISSPIHLYYFFSSITLSENVKFCVGLGLRTVGERIDLNEVDIDSDSRRTLHSKNKNVNMLYDALIKHRENVVGKDFCRFMFWQAFYVLVVK